MRSILSLRNRHAGLFFLTFLVVEFGVCPPGGELARGILPPPLWASPVIIHGPRLALISQNSIAITWETDTPSSSLVHYGLTPSYGSSVSDTTLVRFHTLGLGGLDPSTLYHYQVSSTDGGGTVTSPDYTFRTAVSDSQDFTFVSMADSRGSDQYDSLPAAFSYIINRATAYGPDLTLFVGDAVYGSSDSLRLRSQWDEWKQVTDTLAHTVPMYLAIGNHEANVYSHNYDGALIFRDEFVLPTNGPTGFVELAYSFDYGNAHFVFLDSDVYNAPSRINATQRVWLQNDLQATRKVHKFVFAHEEAYPPSNSTHSSLEDYPSDRDAFWNILLANHVDAFICGHIHLWNRDFFIASGYGNSPPDTSVAQIIDGTCGAPIVNGYGGNYDHFVEWEISGPEVRARVVDNYGVARDSFQYSVTGLESEADEQPTAPRICQLRSNHPNPFNGSTTIPFVLPEAGTGSATLSIYGLDGGMVRRFAGAELGRFSVVWDGRDSRGNKVAAGVYLCELKVGAGFSSAGRVIVVR